MRARRPEDDCRPGEIAIGKPEQGGHCGLKLFGEEIFSFFTTEISAGLAHIEYTDLDKESLEKDEFIKAIWAYANSPLLRSWASADDCAGPCGREGCGGVKGYDHALQAMSLYCSRACELLDEPLDDPRRFGADGSPLCEYRSAP